MIEKILQQLKEQSKESVIKRYQKQGIKEEILGVQKGVIRKLAKEIKQDHELALNLWETNIYEARVLAIELFDANQFELKQIKNLVLSTESIFLIDELTLTIFESLYPHFDILDLWKHEKDLRLVRSAWNAAIANVVTKKYNETQFEQILNVIEKTILKKDELVQYAMNRCVVEIGVRNEVFTDRCFTLGESLGLYKDMKVSKGCTSPYIPDWMNAVLKRKR